MTRPLHQYPHLHDLVERAERVRPEAREVANTVQASIDALTMTVGRGRATWVDDPGCPSAGRGQPA